LAKFSSHLCLSKGASVTEVRPESLTPFDKHRCEEILHDWLNSRWIDPLGFLNTTTPWSLGEDKKYFILKKDNTIWAFLAAIPIWPKMGWYFSDLLRHSEAPVGVTELLVLESMRILKEQGSKTVTLGVSPLSNLPNPATSDRPLLYRAMHFAFEKLNVFYRFKPLYQFKKKFNPTSEVPAYLIHNPLQMGIRSVFHLMETFLPGGILNSSWSFLRRFFLKFQLEKFMLRYANPNLVLRSFPESAEAFVRRIPLTLNLWFVNLLLMFLSPWEKGTLKKTWLERGGFSWTRLVEGHWTVLISSPFLHLNVFEFSFNMTLMLIVGSLMELTCGFRIAAIAFVIPALLANVLSRISLLLFSLVTHWGNLSTIASEPDVGASLGVFGLLGGALYLLRKRTQAFAFVAIAIVTHSFFIQSVQSLNHLFALGLGVWCVRNRVNAKR
jgi:membrane associated rhomboid family serine protease